MTAENTLVLETTQGRVAIAMRPDLAPRHVARIKELVGKGFYNGLVFHRVIDGFMAQTGDGARGDGTGGSKYPNLPAEFSDVPFKRGVVGIHDEELRIRGVWIVCARHADDAFLNGKYTVVGEVLSGMEVVDKIKKGEPVVDPDRMTRVQVAADAK